MPEAVVAQSVLVSLMLTLFIGLFIWGLKTKRFHKVEDSKSHPFDGVNGEDIEEENKSE